MNLVIDAGNSLIKWALFDSQRCIQTNTFKEERLHENLEKLLKAFPTIEKVALCVVGIFAEESRKVLKKKSSVLEISDKIKLPFVNQYKTPQSLGADRMALMGAAYHQFPKKNVLVIDAGTCITMDFIDKFGNYKGGSISPGIAMRYKALNAYTNGLPRLEASHPISIIGNTTHNAIHSGVIHGVVLEIDGMISNYKQEFKDLTVILTGGNTHFLRDRLKNTIFANPNFLFEGLNFLLEYNQ